MLPKNKHPCALYYIHGRRPYNHDSGNDLEYSQWSPIQELKPPKLGHAKLSTRDDSLAPHGCRMALSPCMVSDRWHRQHEPACAARNGQSVTGCQSAS